MKARAMVEAARVRSEDTALPGSVRTLLAQMADSLEAATGAKPPLMLRQARILAFVGDYQQAHAGASPTLEEIATHMGVRALATVHEHLEHLAEKGYIAREHNAVRSITVLRTAA